MATAVILKSLIFLQFSVLRHDYVKMFFVKSTMNTVEFTVYNEDREVRKRFQKMATTERSQSYITVGNSIDPFETQTVYS